MIKDFRSICQAKTVDGNNTVLGDIIWWTFKNITSKRYEVIAALEAEHFDTKLGGRMTDRSAYVRALRLLEKAGDIIVRKVEETAEKSDFQITAEVVDANYLRYDPRVVYSLNKETGAITIANLMGGDAFEAQAALEDLRKRTEHAHEAVTTTDLYRIMGRVFDSEGDIVRIRENGGVYFLPAGRSDLLARIDSFLSRLTGDTVELCRLPLYDSADSRENVMKAVASEVVEEINTIYTELRELDGNKRDCFWNTRAERIQAMNDRAVAYAAMLRGSSAEIENSLNKLSAKLVEVQTGFKVEETLSDTPVAVEVPEAVEAPFGMW